MVRSIAFSWDGSRLATASDDHTARVSDVADPYHPAFVGGHLTGHQDPKTGIKFSQAATTRQYDGGASLTPLTRSSLARL
jgi:WD40 repeat protein